MSLKPFPGLYSSTDSPVHCLGLYNNVLLLFWVNICYWTGSAVFFSAHFSPCALPEECDLNEAIPKDIAIYSSITGYNLSGNIHRAGGDTACGGTACVPRGPCSPSWASSLASPERAVPRVRYGWRVFSWDVALQFLSSSFTLLQGWTNRDLSLCIRFPIVQRGVLESVFG